MHTKMAATTMPGREVKVKTFISDFPTNRLEENVFRLFKTPSLWDLVMKAKLPKLTFLKSLWGSKTLDPSTSVSKHWVWPRLLVITSLENFFAHLGLFASFLTINSGKQTDPNLSLSEANPSLVSPPPPLQLAFQAVGEILRMSQQEF